MPQLECRDLSKSFGGVQALAYVNVDFPASGVVALIGPNGAGKTTLLNALTGLLRPDSGRVIVDGRDITDTPVHERTTLAIARTFQEVRLFRNMTVVDNLLLAGSHTKDERLLRVLTTRRDEAALRKSTQEILQRIRLEPLAQTQASRLSYGQQKLLSIACCLARNMPICLLDEPVAGLDANTRQQISQLLREHAADTRLVVFVEHDLALVSELADHVIVMDAGRVIAQGTPQSVLSDGRVIEAYLD